MSKRLMRRFRFLIVVIALASVSLACEALDAVNRYFGEPETIDYMGLQREERIELFEGI